MVEYAYGKINLILDIIGKRSDQYHELKSFMIPIDFYDTLKFEVASSNEIHLISNVEIKDNSVLKVIEYMKSHYQVSEGVVVKLEKHLPIGAGLAGGSADITACIRGLDKFWNLKLSDQEKEMLANKFGSDTLFTLYSKPAIITGRGDKITFIEMTHKIEDILLIIPNVSLLTKDVFKQFKKENTNDFNDAYNCLLHHDYSKLYNDLLEPALNSNESFKKVYNQLLQKGLNVHLSGSGSTCFILYPTKRDLEILSTFEDLKIIRTKQR